MGIDGPSAGYGSCGTLEAGAAGLDGLGVREGRCSAAGGCGRASLSGAGLSWAVSGLSCLAGTAAASCKGLGITSSAVLFEGLLP